MKSFKKNPNAFEIKRIEFNRSIKEGGKAFSFEIDDNNFIFNFIDDYKREFNILPSYCLMHPNRFSEIRIMGKFFYDEATQREIKLLGNYGHLGSATIRVWSGCEKYKVYLFNIACSKEFIEKDLEKAIFI